MKKFIILFVLAASSVLIFFTAKYINQNGNKDMIIGAWLVEAEAPFKMHLFIFHEDGTMITTNPSNVQENPKLFHGGTNDSLGMGIWKVEKIQGENYVVGTFWQLNAFADNHQPSDTLKVTFKINLKNFEGPAIVCLSNKKTKSYIRVKQRIMLNQSIIDEI